MNSIQFYKSTPTLKSIKEYNKLYYKGYSIKSYININ